MLSLIVVSIVSVLGVGLIQLQASLDRRQFHAADRRSALYIAEAGIAEAAFAVSQGRSGAVASEEVPALYGNGLYWVDSEELPGGRIRLTANSAVGTGRFAIQAIILPNVSPVGEYGFFGEEVVEIGYGTILDGYDSNDGSYPSQLDPALPFTSTGEGVEVYSNGDIIVASEATLPQPGTTGTESPTGGTEGHTPSHETLSGSSSTPYWDSISTSGLDPSLEYSLGTEGAGLMDGAKFDLYDYTTLESMLSAFAEAEMNLLEFDSGEFERLFGYSSYYAITPEGKQVAITAPELVYLRERAHTGASVQQIESFYASVRNPEPAQSDPTIPEGTDGTYLFGELVPGPESYVGTDGGATITETGAPLQEGLSMPPVVLPSNLRVEPGAQTIIAGETRIVTGEDVWMDGIAVEPGGTLVLRGPVTVGAAVLEVALGASIIFEDTDGPVRLHVTDLMALRPGSMIASPTPHEVAFGTHVFIGGRSDSTPGDRIEFAASGEFHGVVYAPDDTLVIPNTVRFFGAAAANRLLIQDWTHASYDLAFATEGVGVPSLPKILSWQVVPLEEGDLRRMRFDPVNALRLRGVDPAPSATAALESDFEAQYIDSAGVSQTYSGPADAFDWSDVSSLSSLRWISPTTGAPLRWTTPSGYDPDQLVAQQRERERMDVFGTEVEPHPLGTDAVLAETAPLEVDVDLTDLLSSAAEPDTVLDSALDATPSLASIALAPEPVAGALEAIEAAPTDATTDAAVAPDSAAMAKTTTETVTAEESIASADVASAEGATLTSADLAQADSLASGTTGTTGTTGTNQDALATTTSTEPVVTTRKVRFRALRNIVTGLGL